MIGSSFFACGIVYFFLAMCCCKKVVEDSKEEFKKKNNHAACSLKGSCCGPSRETDQLDARRVKVELVQRICVASCEDKSS